MAINLGIAIGPALGGFMIEHLARNQFLGNDLGRGGNNG